MSRSNFPFVRITLLGSSHSGKTSCINSFVNNCSPATYQETAWPTLYYKLVRLPPEDDAKGRVQSIALEIEDTFGSTRTDEGRNIKAFLELKRAPVQVPPGVKDFTPFNVWMPPLVPLGVGQRYYPVTVGRMGFIIVFDPHESKSFSEAINIHANFLEDLETKNSRLSPVIFLVATKIDKDPDGETFKSVIMQAEAYSQKTMTRLWKVSTVEGKNVSRMFKDMLYLIVGNQLLWQMELEEESESEEENGRQCAVM